MAAGVALGAPLAVAVTGLLLIGVAHLVLEVRYVLGHYRSMLHGRLLVGANVALLLVVAARLVWAGPVSRTLEIVVVFGLLAAAAVVRLRTRPPLLVAVLVGLAVVATWTLGHADGWFVVQAHLHNLVPAAFLWVWASVALPAGRPRRAFRGVIVLWAVVVPLVLLAGWLDPWLADPAAGPVADVARRGGVLGAIAPAGVDAGLAPRLLALFAFAQVIHYGVWCWFFPRHGGPADAVWDASPTGRVLRRRAVVAALVVAGTAAVVALAWSEYARGRTFYSALGAYHAYLELPVLLALVTGLRPTGGERGEGDPASVVGGRPNGQVSGDASGAPGAALG